MWDVGGGRTVAERWLFLHGTSLLEQTTYRCHRRSLKRGGTIQLDNRCPLELLSRSLDGIMGKFIPRLCEFYRWSPGTSPPPAPPTLSRRFRIPQQSLVPPGGRGTSPTNNNLRGGGTGIHGLDVHTGLHSTSIRDGASEYYNAYEKS